MPVAFMAMNFAVAVENTECDQHGDEHCQRRNLVEHAGGEVDQVVAHRDQRSGLRIMSPSNSKNVNTSSSSRKLTSTITKVQRNWRRT